MNMDAMLIQTALLALQQQGELQYTSRLGNTPSGFYKQTYYLGTDKLGKFTTIVYLNPKSTTGFSIRIEASAIAPELLLHDVPLENFAQFEEELQRDWSLSATKAQRRRQLGK